MKTYRTQEFQATEGRGVFLLIGGIILIAILVVSACLLSGCVHTSEWLEQRPEYVQKAFGKAVGRLKKKARSAGLEEGQPEGEQGANATDGDFGAFKWTYGGFNGSGAIRDERVTIVNVRFDKNRVSHNFESGDLSEWGLKHSEAGALACFFVKNNQGEWVGGKFDWISSSRLFRELKHITGSEPYKGWTLSDVPNPCECAYVIVDYKGGRRTNVAKGIWNR